MISFMQARTVENIITPVSVLEGAGVRLKRSFPGGRLNYLDPFLLLDHFGSSNPDDYIAGFPMHPHRGIETVTYILKGAVSHRDSIGNEGTISVGDVQWMTSGRGILHEEMPQVRSEGMDGFQLWVNLPARDKMTKPRYQDVRSDRIPQFTSDDGALIRLIAGNVGDVSGPVKEIAADPIYMDVTVPPRSTFRQAIQKGHNAFAYVFDGRGFFGGSSKDKAARLENPSLAILSDGDLLNVYTGNDPVRFLLVSGEPLNEPVARYGPFVMNTKQEIEQALDDLRRGTFVRKD
jgi:redox-sensitive bicupin YhaK (pirin superfamily)